ncbi:hypothetical protein WGM54_14745 [Paenibacillus polymyxa]|uniref:hypothetical protein n=1 Tax=Paenibacillus polymyxa TaxID=1406 RepID=UPI00307F9812
MFTIKYGQQVWGSVAIDKKIAITSSTNTFGFDVDGRSYSITIPNGTYSTNRERHESELIQVIITAASNQNIPVEFRLGGMHYDERYNVLIIEHTDKENTHVLNNFTGTANDILFGSIKFDLKPRD